jgi:cytochrome c peroxidase
MRFRAISSASTILVAIVTLGACGQAGPQQGDEPAAASTTETTGTEQIAPPGAESLVANAVTVFRPIPATPPVLETNPMTPEKVELGKMLFFEPRLSASWLISCNTCHNLGLGGVDLQETSIGHGWQRGPRNAPTVLNAVFNIAQFWDGRAEDLMEQAMGPVQAAVEMNSTPERVVATLRSIPEYVDRFGRAFPDDPGPLTFENMARAIEAFEATLITPGSRFDRYLEGEETALTTREIAGLGTFMDKGCAACHAGVNLGGSGYYPFGVLQKPGADLLPPEDKGRFEVTRTIADEYVFKSPSLRNVALTAPYFHSGVVWDLGKAVGVMGSVQLGAELTPADVDAIVAFLGSLNGEQPNVRYPVLPSHTEATPPPFVEPTTTPGRGD